MSYLEFFPSVTLTWFATAQWLLRTPDPSPLLSCSPYLSFFSPSPFLFPRVLLPEMLRLAQILIFSRGFFLSNIYNKTPKKKKIMKLIKCVNFLTVNRLISYTIHCHMFGAVHHTVKHIWGLACQLLFVTLPMIYNHVWAYWADNDLVFFFHWCLVEHWFELAVLFYKRISVSTYTNNMLYHVLEMQMYLQLLKSLNVVF